MLFCAVISLCRHTFTVHFIFFLTFHVRCTSLYSSCHYKQLKAVGCISCCWCLVIMIIITTNSLCMHSVYCLLWRLVEKLVNHHREIFESGPPAGNSREFGLSQIPEGIPEGIPRNFAKIQIFVFLGIFHLRNGLDYRFQVHQTY